MVRRQEIVASVHIVPALFDPTMASLAGLNVCAGTGSPDCRSKPATPLLTFGERERARRLAPEYRVVGRPWYVRANAESIGSLSDL